MSRTLWPKMYGHYPHKIALAFLCRLVYCAVLVVIIIFMIALILIIITYHLVGYLSMKPKDNCRIQVFCDHGFTSNDFNTVAVVIHSVGLLRLRSIIARKG